MENKTNNKVSDFIKTEVLKFERNSFVFQILIVVVGYIGITLWLNAIRATASLWFVWALIIIQFILYCSIFSVGYLRSLKCGLNKNFGFILFIILAILGRVENWELFIIPVFIIIMLIFSARNLKKMSNK